MIELNDCGVIISPPDIVKKYKLDNRNYLTLKYYELENGGFVYSYNLEYDDGYTGCSGPATLYNAHATFKAAENHSLELVIKHLSGSCHKETHKLKMLIEVESQQMDLFGEVV